MTNLRGHKYVIWGVIAASAALWALIGFGVSMVL